MTVKDVAKSLGVEIVVDNEGLQREITGGYASDLLSDVMAHSKAGNLWVTLQTHSNIIAVATLKDLAAILLVNGRRLDSDALARAQQEKVVILSSQLPTFELVGRLYQMGVRGGG